MSLLVCIILYLFIPFSLSFLFCIHANSLFFNLTICSSKSILWFSEAQLWDTWFSLVSTTYINILSKFLKASNNLSSFVEAFNLQGRRYINGSKCSLTRLFSPNIKNLWLKSILLLFYKEKSLQSLKFWNFVAVF